MAKPYLDSNSLIDTVKRNMSFPISQNTFSNDDILSFANQELFGVQVPSIMEVHEDYFTFAEDIPLKANKSRYDIPYRAIGLKLNNVYWMDENQNSGKLTFVDNNSQALYSNSWDGMNSPSCYFIEANQVCLNPQIGPSVTGSLRFSYFLRPNNLVVNERAAICQNFTRDITIDTDTMVSGDALRIGDTYFVAGIDFAIGATDLATATNLNVAINLQAEYSSTVTNNVVIIRYPSSTIIVTSSNSAAISIENVQGIEFDQVPTNITNSSLIDFLKVKGGHRTYKIDVKLGRNVVSANIVKFPIGVVPEEFEAGDYICSQFECIIPQIPSDLHNILAERTVARILESLGDTVGLQTANAKIGQMEARQQTLIDNRVEGSPRKVVNRGSLLRTNKNRRF